MTEKRYTRAEFEDMLRSEICDQQGHDYQLIINGDNNWPDKVMCRRCKLWSVVRNPTERGDAS